MRLVRIKISGFKSFVDPTTIVFPGLLTGVVGPNGCGKSNVIDAVRWVLGESKASELRGESIQDVIFKGCGTRKEVGRASVELHFDNSAGRASGQWSTYAEITVKRVLDREGFSNYHINNLHVRRRDVIDLFLGTGLGPRSYAIISQGTIARIVDARPDEVKLYLEEAAGITRYKERRRETEQRLESTHEHIQAASLVRDELAAQLIRLTAQAEAARNYRQLEAAHSKAQVLLWLKKRNDAKQDGEKIATKISQAQTSLEGEIAKLRSIEASIEEARVQRHAASDALNVAQTDSYTISAEIKRLEREIGFVEETRTRLTENLQQIATEEHHWREEVKRAENEDLHWRTLLTAANAQMTEAQRALTIAQAAIPAREQEMKAAETAREVVQREMLTIEQRRQLAFADSSHAQRAIEQLKQRAERIQIALEALPPEALSSFESSGRNSQQEFLANLQAELANALAATQNHKARFELASDLSAARMQMQNAHQHQAEVTARFAALQTLQLKLTLEGNIETWLSNNELSAEALWQSIRVESGWETALEAVLNVRLGAHSAEPAAALAALRSSLTEKVPTSVTLALAQNSSAQPYNLANDLPPLHHESLRAKVECRDPRWEGLLDYWLDKVYCSENLLQEWPWPAERFHHLAPGQQPRMLVSRDGHTLTAYEITLFAPNAQTHGLLERERELEALETEVAKAIEIENSAQAELAAQEKNLRILQEQLLQMQASNDALQVRIHDSQVALLSANHMAERAQELERERQEIQTQMELEHEAEHAAQTEEKSSDSALASVRIQLEAATQLLIGREEQLRFARALEQKLTREFQESNFTVRECTTRLEENGRVVQTGNRELERIERERTLIQDELQTCDASQFALALQEALNARNSREEILVDLRAKLEGASAAFKKIDTERTTLEVALQPARERINDLQLKQQAALLNAEQWQQRLIEMEMGSEAEEAPFVAELATMNTAGNLANELANEVTRLATQIAALGAVNLAALEELTEIQERKEKLDLQIADLIAAMNTLENSMRHIDRQTREQLLETFTAVNKNFGALFPRLFGGGEAHLVLTDEEILNAGVQIVAQPPGKRNSTIQMLSGGEKALAAIALVFGLFQLNPAPFCMLDEVDAPLDDDNTERFCDLVKNIATQTQFIFITHNKIAMEMAEQLIGVTMQEQGVSRVVEVDVAEALRLSA